MSTLRTNTLTDAAGGNSMPVADINQGRAKAWANVNGTGTVAARDSFNISRFVDLGVGQYTANISVARPSANYQISAGASGAAGSVVGSSPDAAIPRTASAFSIYEYITTFAVVDATYADAAINGDPT